MNKVKEIIDTAKSEDRNVLTEFESKELIKSLDLPITEQILVGEDEGFEGVKKACSTIGYPVVMKLIAEDVVHKSDVGAVKLNIGDEDDAKSAFDELMKIESQAKKSISVQEMAKEPVAEIIVGSLQDAQFGPTVMFGIGGVLVEVMEDVSFRIAPINDFDADEMVHEIKGFKILDGYRGKPPADLDSIKHVLKEISELVYEHQEISEMDLNPVFAYEDGLKIVDARIILNN